MIWPLHATISSTAMSKEDIYLAALICIHILTFFFFNLIKAHYSKHRDRVWISKNTARLLSKISCVVSSLIPEKHCSHSLTQFYSTTQITTTWKVLFISAWETKRQRGRSRCTQPYGGGTVEGGFQEEISMESDISNNCNNAVFSEACTLGPLTGKRKAEA